MTTTDLVTDPAAVARDWRADFRNEALEARTGTVRESDLAASLLITLDALENADKRIDELAGWKSAGQEWQARAERYAAKYEAEYSLVEELRDQIERMDREIRELRGGYPQSAVLSKIEVLLDLMGSHG